MTKFELNKIMMPFLDIGETCKQGKVAVSISVGEEGGLNALLDGHMQSGVPADPDGGASDAAGDRLASAPHVSLRRQGSLSARVAAKDGAAHKTSSSSSYNCIRTLYDYEIRHGNGLSVASDFPTSLDRRLSTPEGVCVCGCGCGLGCSCGCDAGFAEGYTADGAIMTGDELTGVCPSCGRRHRERRNGVLSIRRRRNGILSIRRRRNGVLAAAEADRNEPTADGSTTRPVSPFPALADGANGLNSGYCRYCRGVFSDAGEEEVADMEEVEVAEVEDGYVAAGGGSSAPSGDHAGDSRAGRAGTGSGALSAGADSSSPSSLSYKSRRQTLSPPQQQWQRQGSLTKRSCCHCDGRPCWERGQGCRRTQHPLLGAEQQPTPPQQQREQLQLREPFEGSQDGAGPEHTQADTEPVPGFDQRSSWQQQQQEQQQASEGTTKSEPRDGEVLAAEFLAGFRRWRPSDETDVAEQGSRAAPSGLPDHPFMSTDAAAPGGGPGMQRSPAPAPQSRGGGGGGGGGQQSARQYRLTTNLVEAAPYPKGAPLYRDGLAGLDAVACSGEDGVIVAAVTMGHPADWDEGHGARRSPRAPLHAGLPPATAAGAPACSTAAASQRHSVEEGLPVPPQSPASVSVAVVTSPALDLLARRVPPRRAVSLAALPERLTDAAGLRLAPSPPSFCHQQPQQQPQHHLHLTLPGSLAPLPILQQHPQHPSHHATASLIFDMASAGPRRQLLRRSASSLGVVSVTRPVPLQQQQPVAAAAQAEDSNCYPLQSPLQSPSAVSGRLHSPILAAGGGGVAAALSGVRSCLGAAGPNGSRRPSLWSYTTSVLSDVEDGSEGEEGEELTGQSGRRGVGVGVGGVRHDPSAAATTTAATGSAASAAPVASPRASSATAVGKEQEHRQEPSGVESMGTRAVGPRGAMNGVDSSRPRSPGVAVKPSSSSSVAAAMALAAAVNNAAAAGVTTPTAAAAAAGAGSGSSSGGSTTSRTFGPMGLKATRTQIRASLHDTAVGCHSTSLTPVPPQARSLRGGGFPAADGQHQQQQQLRSGGGLQNNSWPVRKAAAAGPAGGRALSLLEVHGFATFSTPCAGAASPTTTPLHSPSSQPTAQAQTVQEARGHPAFAAGSSTSPSPTSPRGVVQHSPRLSKWVQPLRQLMRPSGQAQPKQPPAAVSPSGGVQQTPPGRVAETEPRRPPREAERSQATKSGSQPGIAVGLSLRKALANCPPPLSLPPISPAGTQPQTVLE